MKKTVGIILRYILPILLLAGALAGASALFASREQPQPESKTDPGVLVTTRPIEREPQRLDVLAQGQVTAARRLTLQPEVSGRLLEVHDQLIPGGIIAEGELLYRVDARDYRIGVAEAQAAVADAQARLNLEKGQQVIARKEWELFNDAEAPGKDDALALRKPQLRQARVGIQSAGARLRRQQLNLNRTRFTAPFNAVVLTEAAELGQLVGPQNTIATLAGTDQFWVEVAVPVAELDRIDIPGTNTRNPDGAKAIVTQDLGSKRIVRPGRVVRLMGELDTQGSMAKVLVAIDDPLQLKLPLDERGLPMLIGSFVDVTLVGNRSEPLIAIPREALRDGDSIWVAKEGRLEIRPITIAYSKPDTIFVRDAVKPGEALITSRIPVPIPNMKVRIDDAAHSSKKTAAVAPTQEAAP